MTNELIEFLESIESVTKSDFFTKMKEVVDTNDIEENLKLIKVLKNKFHIDSDIIDNVVTELESKKDILYTQELSDVLYDGVLNGIVLRKKLNTEYNVYVSQVDELSLKEVLNEKQKEIIQRTERELKKNLSKFYDVDNNIFNEQSLRDEFSNIDFELEKGEHPFHLDTLIKYSNDQLVRSKRSFIIFFALSFKEDQNKIASLKTNFNYDTYGLIRDAKWDFLF